MACRAHRARTNHVRDTSFWNIAIFEATRVVVSGLLVNAHRILQVGDLQRGGGIHVALFEKRLAGFAKRRGKRFGDEVDLIGARDTLSPRCARSPFLFVRELQQS